MPWHSSVLIPFITLQCNFNCLYCITKHAPDHQFSYTHLSGPQWILFINSQDAVQDVIFNGGEPTLHPDFPDIINSLRSFRLIAVGTNYSDSATRALLKISPRADLILDGTFHPRSISFPDICVNLRKLKQAGFKVRVHVLDYPGFIASPARWVHCFKLKGIDSFVQKFEGFYKDDFFYDQRKLPFCGFNARSSCRCTRSIYTPIAPDGTIYFCHYLMYSNSVDGRLGNVLDPPLSFPPYLDCAHLGFCSVCDWPRSISFV